MGLTLLALQRRRRQIAAADVFREPGLQGSGECRGLPVQTVPEVRSLYFPMQKRENTRSSTASVSSSPVISPSARIASRKSMVQKSHGSC